MLGLKNFAAACSFQSVDIYVNDYPDVILRHSDFFKLINFYLSCQEQLTGYGNSRFPGRNYMSLFKEGRYVAPGNIVEFMHGNQPQLAFVMEEQSGKLKLYTINKREMKMPAARILPWVGPQYSQTATRQEMLDLMVTHQEKRGELQAGLDTMEIWELAQGELEKAPLEWFAGLLWEDPDPDRISALGRAMIAAKTHFKFQQPDFLIYTQEKVETRLKQQAEEKAYEDILNAGQELFKNIWAARENGGRITPDRIPDMSDDIKRRLRDFLMERISGNGDENSNKMWTVLKKVFLIIHTCRCFWLRDGE